MNPARSLEAPNRLPAETLATIGSGLSAAAAFVSPDVEAPAVFARSTMALLPGAVTRDATSAPAGAGAASYFGLRFGSCMKVSTPEAILEGLELAWIEMNRSVRLELAIAVRSSRAIKRSESRVRMTSMSG